LEEGEPGGGAEIPCTAGDDGVAGDAEALEGGVGAGDATDGDFFRGGGLWTGVGGWRWRAEGHFGDWGSRGEFGAVGGHCRDSDWESATGADVVSLVSCSCCYSSDWECPMNEARFN